MLITVQGKNATTKMLYNFQLTDAMHKAGRVYSHSVNYAMVGCRVHGSPYGYTHGWQHTAAV